MESHHQAAGVWPWLAAKIAQVGDGESCLFHYLAMHGFLKRFSRLDKSRYESKEVATEVAGMNEQHLIATMHKNDDGGGERGPHLLATLLATLAYVGVHLHLSAADTAELGVLVPIEQFLAFARLLV